MPVRPTVLVTKTGFFCIWLFGPGRGGEVNRWTGCSFTLSGNNERLIREIVPCKRFSPRLSSIEDGDCLNRRSDGYFMTSDARDLIDNLDNLEGNLVVDFNLCERGFRLSATKGICPPEATGIIDTAQDLAYNNSQ